jgi:hypothetical protein
LKLLLLHEDLVEWTAAHLDVNWVRHPLVRQFVTQRLEAHRNQTWRDLPGFLDQCEAPELRNLITGAIMEARPLPDPAQQIADVTLRLRNGHLERQIAALLQRMSQPEITEDQRLEFLKQQQQLRALKRQPLNGGV